MDDELIRDMNIVLNERERLVCYCSVCKKEVLKKESIFKYNIYICKLCLKVNIELRKIWNIKR